MRIGILSDTHDQVARTASAVRLLVAEGSEALIHCGDITIPDVVYECARLPTYFVFGNNDFDQDDLRRAMNDSDGVCLGRAGEIMIGGKRIAVAHGDSSRDYRRLLGTRPDYLFYGHTHVAADGRDGPTREINPGAIYRASVWTVATLDLETDSLRFHTVTDPIVRGR
ncbi:metallophosphoesterase family protein [Singulisphaera rosea]